MPRTLPASMNTHRPFTCQMLFDGAGGVNPNGLVACLGPGQPIKDLSDGQLSGLVQDLGYFFLSS